MKIAYRLAEERDLHGAHQALIEALNQSARERNQPLLEIDFQDSLPLWRHFLGTSEGGFWVAEAKDRLVGFTCSIPRDRLWYLSYLVVHPEYQGQGIARELLTRVLEGSYRGRIEVRAAYADTANWVSVSLYARHGLFPRVPLLHLQGSITEIAPPAEEKQPPEFEVAQLSEETLRALGALDEEVRGVRREVDHRFWLGVPGMRSYLFHRAGNPVAYAYLSDDGTIGPLATLRQDDVRPILNFALERLSDQGVDRFSVRVPGLNTEAISLLYERGFTLQEMSLILSSQPFGHWEN
ncbi:MAG: GNAT family N-acetyltransferase, partial [Chloroflexi bacterium]|nr:GNAT family N-acetyltransferase [Chloroflexota bacterium]